MAVITIDGTRLEVPENKNVLECALEAGIYIPHLCHHPDLPENGSCRMCIVEVEGQEGVTTSCTLRAQDGMVVHTTSERINKLRTLALELLLAGHPEDCSTCPKYGNCELQTLIQYIGANNARMRTRIKGIKMEEGNPLLIHDMNRCVLCGRCVRACNKLRGVGVLQYNKKDLETYVGTLHGKLLKDEDCRFCTACAEVCPTGSIRDKLQLLTTNLKKEEALVPCRTACPAHTDIPRYIRFVKEGDYDLGFAFDGDADRVLFVDHKGDVIDGDKIMYMLSKYLKEHNLLTNNTLVTTVMSNMGLFKALEKIDINTNITPVGDKYVLESMLNNDFVIGGEQSGHIIYKNDANYGDGLRNALFVLKVLQEKNMNIDEATSELRVYPQLLVNQRVVDKTIVLNDETINSKIKEISDELGDNGRILVRPSGTEPLIRVMVEAETDELCHKDVYEVIDLIKEKGYCA